MLQVLGLISCTGTNFMLRAEAWQEVDGLPEHTVTEDFAMGIELTLRRWRCIFVPAILAIGEAPETTRKVERKLLLYSLLPTFAVSDCMRFCRTARLSHELCRICPTA